VNVELTCAESAQYPVEFARFTLNGPCAALLPPGGVSPNIVELTTSTHEVEVAIHDIDKLARTSTVTGIESMLLVDPLVI
jgi:hypothetical protein